MLLYKKNVAHDFRYDPCIFLQFGISVFFENMQKKSDLMNI